jgi:hypothetical protein
MVRFSVAAGERRPGANADGRLHRSELAARLQFEQYDPRVWSDVPPSPYGGFLDTRLPPQGLPSLPYAVMSTQIDELGAVVSAHFGPTPGR